MAGLKEIRTRISSITSTQKITGAMKMVSAAKFHKAQETVFRFQNYSKKVTQVLAQVVLSAPKSEMNIWFSQPKTIKRAALVVVTSNSSMCAGFNQNLIKKVMEEGPTVLPEIWNTNNLDIYCLGKKGFDFFKKGGYNIVLSDTQIVNKPNYISSSGFCDEHLFENFSSQKYNVVFVAYNVFKNPALQEPTISQFLPFPLPEGTKTNDFSDVIFEPNPVQIMQTLIPTALKTRFYEIILENSIGEHGARMTAMHQATENALELIKSLKLQYNKARQAAITKEILEIVSGAEALKG
jgi:F-type H+-transporting ATPase subunit gamma